MNNEFQIEYKARISETRGLCGVFSSHPLPVGSIVAVNGASLIVRSTQPLIIRYFVKIKKIHVYYDGYRIYQGFATCLDRIILKPIVDNIILSSGISDYPHLLESFKNQFVDEFIEFVGTDRKVHNARRLNIHLNHFDERVELNKY